jgi:hypothetical protein
MFLLERVVFFNPQSNPQPMKKILLAPLAVVALSVGSLHAQLINDAINDIDAGISTGDGTLDIVSMEVSTTATDVTFALTVNGNISTTDWGNFMIGIATGNTAGTTTGNAWSRPINLDSPIGGMNYWIGSWVNSGGGSQLWSYNGASWDGPTALAGYSFTAGATSLINYTISLSSIGIIAPQTIYFDAFSSGGGGGDSAVDALSNPNISITSWDQTYTSSTATGISSATVPEPSTYALLALSAAAVGGYMARRRTRK